MTQQTERDALIAECQELNTGNYSDDQVRELNHWAACAYDTLKAQAQRIVELETQMESLRSATIKQTMNESRLFLERDTLRAELDALRNAIHSCGPTCTKAGCVNRRLTDERDEYRLAADTMAAAHKVERDALAKGTTCTWTKDPDFEMGDTYHSACGELWSFIDGGPNENHARYCHGCGGKVSMAQGGDE